MLWIFNLFFAKDVGIGIVIGIIVLVFWFGTSCMRTWHGYGLSIGLSDPSLFTSYTKACALCSITQHYITLHYAQLHQATFLTPRHVPYAAPSAFGTGRLPLRLLVRDQMPRDLSAPFVAQPNLFDWPPRQMHVKYGRLLVVTPQMDTAQTSKLCFLFNQAFETVS